VAVYTEAVSKLNQKSYEIWILVPSGIKRPTLENAARYLSQYTGYSQALELLEATRRGQNKIKFSDFFPSHVKMLLHTLDYQMQFNCHIFASYFNFAHTKHGSGNANVRFQDNNQYYETIGLNQAASFGDVISLGNSHSAVYLASGFVVMKDDSGRYQPIRIVHLSDLERTSDKKMNSIQYIDRFASQIRRYRR
jgi:hypothetical protein